MVTCKDCLHNHVCALWRAQEGQDAKSWSDSDDWDCDYFADKSRFVEFPCKIGDVVYAVVVNAVTLNYRILRGYISCIDVRSTGYHVIICHEGLDDVPYFDKIYGRFDNFGESIFLTREEAEAALAERMKENG